MKRFLRIISVSLLVSALIQSCTKETTYEITFDDSSISSIVQSSIPADADVAQSITFTATDDWHIEISSVTKADGEAGWIRVSPDHGTAGAYTLTISMDKNTSTESRSASINIICGDESKDIEITQLGVEIKPAGMIKHIVVEGSDWNCSTRVNPDGTSYTERPLVDIAYEYDSEGRISVLEFKTEDDENQRYEVEYQDGMAIVKAEYYGEVEEMEVALDSEGRPVDFYGEILKYNEAGHLVGDYYDEEDYTIYLYKDGAMIGATSNSSDIEAKTEKYSKYLDIIYPNRYPSSRTNIDLNSLIMALEECVNSVGLLVGGVSLGDYLMEAPFFAVTESASTVTGISDLAPGTVFQEDLNYDGKIDEEDYYTRTDFSSDIPLGKWTFDENQWPTGYECEISKDQYSVAFVNTVTDRIVTDEDYIMWYIGVYYPDADPQEILKTHTFYEVERSMQKTVAKQNIESYPYSVKIEYY